MSDITYRKTEKGWKKSPTTGGVCLRISFDKLGDMLREVNLVRKDERVVQTAIDEYGVTFYVET